VILVDSSVWVDVLRDRDTDFQVIAQVRPLRQRYLQWHV